MENKETEKLEMKRKLPKISIFLSVVLLILAVLLLTTWALWSKKQIIARIDNDLVMRKDKIESLYMWRKWTQNQKMMNVLSDSKEVFEEIQFIREFAEEHPGNGTYNSYRVYGKSNQLLGELIYDPDNDAYCVVDGVPCVLIGEYAYAYKLEYDKGSDSIVAKFTGCNDKSSKNTVLYDTAIKVIADNSSMICDAESYLDLYAKGSSGQYRFIAFSIPVFYGRFEGETINSVMNPMRLTDELYMTTAFSFSEEDDFEITIGSPLVLFYDMKPELNEWRNQLGVNIFLCLAAYTIIVFFSLLLETKNPTKPIVETAEKKEKEEEYISSHLAEVILSRIEDMENSTGPSPQIEQLRTKIDRLRGKVPEDEEKTEE